MFRTIVPALVVPLLLATACSTQAGEAVPVQTASPAGLLRAVPDNVAKASTGQIQVTFTIDGPESTFALGGAGAFDRAAGQAALTLDLGALGASFDEPLEIVADGAVTYLRLPMLASLTGSAGWLSASAEDLGQAGDALGLPAVGADPTQILEALRGAGAVDEVGQQDVRGVRTTRYDATIDLGEALTDVPVSVWIDADGLARRVQVELDGAGPWGSEGEGQITMILELFDYGEPVQIVVPSPAGATPFSEIASLLVSAFTDEPA